jgi:hypothetical protein
MERYRIVVKDVFPDVHLVENPCGVWGLILESGPPFVTFETTPYPKPEVDEGDNIELNDWYGALHEFNYELQMKPMMGSFLMKHFEPEGDETVAEWLFCRLAQMLQLRFAGGPPYHVGLCSYRRVREPLEDAFAARWEQLNDQSDLLPGLLAIPQSEEPPVTRWEATTAATVIQWLGSPVGISFIEEVTGVDIQKQMQANRRKKR